MDIYGIGGLSRRELLKMSTVLAASGHCSQETLLLRKRSFGVRPIRYSGRSFH
jgi:hypothetical protein